MKLNLDKLGADAGDISTPESRRIEESMSYEGNTSWGFQTESLPVGVHGVDNVGVLLGALSALACLQKKWVLKKN